MKNLQESQFLNFELSRHVSVAILFTFFLMSIAFAEMPALQKKNENQNLIPNSSFEDSVTGKKPGLDWWFSSVITKGQKPSKGEYLNNEVTHKKQAHAGQCCVVIEGGGAGAWLSPYIKSKSNTVYKLVAWVKGVGNASITVQTFDVANKAGPVVRLPFFLSPDWQQVEMGFVSESDTTRFRIDLNGNGAKNVWFDDISLVEDARGRSLPKVNTYRFSFEGKNAMMGWSKTKGATVIPSADYLEIQGEDWNSLIYRSINLRAGRYRLSGRGAGKLMIYIAKDWSGKRMTMVNLSGKKIRSDEQSFDFPGGQLLLVLQAWGDKAHAKVKWVEIALKKLANEKSKILK